MKAEACAFPVHGEGWARNALARARHRGEEKFMWHCPLADHWHVTDRPFWVLLDIAAEALENEGDR